MIHHDMQKNKYAYHSRFNQMHHQYAMEVYIVLCYWHNKINQWYDLIVGALPYLNSLTINTQRNAHDGSFAPPIPPH